MNRILILAALSLCVVLPAQAGQRLICASTTSTQNSGLFEHILPIFKKETGIEVHVIAVGTGAAIKYGRRGDADVVLVHAKDLELEMVKEGHFISRRDVMYNDFVIIGPPGDPATIKGAGSAMEALRKIQMSRSPFVSRGDGSGTHKKELKLWAGAGIEPKGRKWYMEVGQGMAKTQRVANEKRAYTLTDRGTWLAKMDTLGLEVLFDGDPDLFNQYGVMAVNPERHPRTRIREARAFIDWLMSKQGQAAIGAFRTEKGERLFTPNYTDNNGNTR
jgi:tungstate transport system substrate-binding protein